MLEASRALAPGQPACVPEGQGGVPGRPEGTGEVRPRLLASGAEFDTSEDGAGGAYESSHCKGVVFSTL